MKKQLMVALAAGALVAAVAAPAAATPSDDVGHKQYVCHRTNSANLDKAFVVVHVDYATWSKGGAPDDGNGHQRVHNKDRDREDNDVNDNLYLNGLTAPDSKHLSEAQAAEFCGEAEIFE